MRMPVFIVNCFRRCGVHSGEEGRFGQVDHTLGHAKGRGYCCLDFTADIPGQMENRIKVNPELSSELNISLKEMEAIIF